MGNVSQPVAKKFVSLQYLFDEKAGLQEQLKHANTKRLHIMNNYMFYNTELMNIVYDRKHQIKHLISESFDRREIVHILFGSSNLEAISLSVSPYESNYYIFKPLEIGKSILFAKIQHVEMFIPCTLVDVKYLLRVSHVVFYFSVCGLQYTLQADLSYKGPFYPSAEDTLTVQFDNETRVTYNSIDSQHNLRILLPWLHTDAGIKYNTILQKCQYLTVKLLMNEKYIEDAAREYDMCLQEEIQAIDSCYTLLNGFKMIEQTTDFHIKKKILCDDMIKPLFFDATISASKHTAYIKTLFRSRVHQISKF